MGRGSSAVSKGGGGAAVLSNVVGNPQTLTDAQANALREQYESGFDADTKKSVEKYISMDAVDNKSHSASQVMNFLISRGENLDTITADEINAKYGLGITSKDVTMLKKMNHNIDGAMHNLGVDALLERGAHAGQITQMFGADVAGYTSMTPEQLSKAFVGKAFANTAVWSTSYNTSKNPFLSSSSSQSGGREVIYRIKAGKNTQCVFGATNQAEIVLGKIQSSESPAHHLQVRQHIPKQVALLSRLSLILRHSKGRKGATMAAKKKSSIDDFKNRFDSPVVGVRIDPKTGRPLRKKSAKKRTR